MARVPGRGAAARTGRSKRVWLMVVGIALFLIFMLPSEKYQLAIAVVDAAQQATAATAAATDPAQQQAEPKGAAAVQGAAGEDTAAAASAEAAKPEQGATASAATEEHEEPAAKQGAAAGSEGASDGGAAGVGTGVWFEVPGAKETDPVTRREMLNEPVPDDCFPEEHADYDGPSLTWGLTFKLPSAAQCCQACKDRKELQPDGKRCNIWVWCGSPTGVCWSRDIWNHTTGECWLKYQEKWDNNVDRAATNLVVNNRGKYAPEFRQEHKTSPEEVAWTAGLIPADKPPAQ